MTKQEYCSVFDEISCSGDLKERMEQQLAAPKAAAEGFNDSVSGVKVIKRNPIIRTGVGIAACLAFIVIGCSVGMVFNGGVPTTSFTPSTTVPTTEPTTEESSETPTTENPTQETELILYPEKAIPLYDDFPMQDFSGLSEEQLIEVGKKYYDAAFRLQHPNDAPPYLFFYSKIDEKDEDGLVYALVADDHVKTVEDVRDDFYSVFTSDQDSSIVEQHFTVRDGKLYYRCKNPHVSIHPSDYVLELDTVTENEIYYSYRITQENILLPEGERYKNVTLPFTLKRTEEGWKVSVFMSPFDLLEFNE